jgi:hypothetical protein
MRKSQLPIPKLNCWVLEHYRYPRVGSEPGENYRSY